MNYRKSRLKQNPLTASKLSPSCFQQLLPDSKNKTKKQKIQNSIENYVQIYELYLKMLFGQEISFQDEKYINQKFQLFQQEDDTIQELDLPETVVSLQNPDRIPDDFEYPLKQVEYFEQIIKSLKIDEKSIHDKLFLKAIENVFTNLSDRKVYSLFELRTRGIETQPNQGRHTLIGYGTGQQLFQRTPDRSPRSLILDDKHHHENKTEVFPIYEKEDDISKLVRKFRNYLKEYANQNKGNLTNIMDSIQIDFQSLLYTSKKAYSQGEYLKTQGNTWYRTNNDTQDLLTLIRNILIIQFSRKGYNVKPVLSKDGSKIYLLLYIPEKSLEVAAENFCLQKKLSFCFTDLLSLEPVDSEFRPLRLNGRLWKPDEYDLSPYFKYLRPLIIEQIKNINFKKLAREVGQSGLNAELFEYEKSEMYGDENGPSDEEWTAYYKYLVHLNKNVQVQRQKYLINNDIALILNKQKTVEEIYAIRNHQSFSYYAQYNPEDQEKINKIYDQIRELSSQIQNLPIFQKIPKIKKIKLLLQQQLAYNYLNIFKEALKVANCPILHLKSLWDRNQQIPLEIFIPFKIHFNNSTLKQQAKFQLRWCRYIKNEENQITLFPTHERLKLSQQLIISSANMNTLINLQLVNGVFCLHDHYELYGHCKSIQQAFSQDKDFYKKKPFDLAGEWILDFKQPWTLPIEQICSYFGEKIGLYFEFSAYYVKFYSILSMIAIIYTILMQSSKLFNKELYNILIATFSMLLIHWSSFVTDYWNQIQLQFNIKYGQNKNVKESIIRTAFKGRHIRSIGNDQLNSIGIVQSQIIQKICISVSILIFLIGSDIGIIIGLYFFNLFLKTLLDSANNQFQYLEIIISGSLNYGIQYLIDSYYEKIATVLTDFENFQTSFQYETSYIMKKYTLYWFSQLFPIMIVCFLHTPLDLYCEQENCKEEVKYLFGTTIFWIFCFKIIKFLKIYLQEQKNTENKKQFQFSLSLIEFIEEEELKTPFQQSQEKYGIIDEYMEFFLQLTLINLFGCLLPLTITLFWFWIIIQVQIQKYRLLYQIQRPWPKGDGSIGIWNEVNQLINFVTLLCNSGLICIYYHEQLQDQAILLFLPLLFYNFSVKYITMSLFGGIPTILEQIIRRGQYIFKNNIQITTISRKQTKDNKNQLQRCPLYKIFGSNGIQVAEDFETISSDNDITDYYLKNSHAISKRMVQEEEDYQQRLTELSQQNEPQNQLYTPLNTQRKIQTEGSEQMSRTIFSFYKENVNKQETQIQKKQKIKIEELIKKIKQVETLDYEFFFNYFSKRATNYAFEIQNCNVTDKQLKRDRTKIWRFFFRLILLSSYKLLWSDYRFFVSQSFVKRKQKIFQNLDYKRYKILSQCFNNQLEFFKNKANLKFRRQFKQFGKKLTSEEEKEYGEVLLKYHNYIEKKSWLNCRKVQIFRYKGLFFRGFRKQTTKKPSIKFALDYYEAMKKLEQVKFESDIHKKFSTLVQYSSINQYTLDSFIELFVKLEYEQQRKFAFPSINGTLKQKYYFLQPLKSEIYKHVIDKSKDTYIFEQYSLKLEEYILQYCLDEWNQIPNIKLKKHLHDILWIVQIEEQEYLMQFFQVRHGQKLNFQKFHDDKYGVFLAESKNYIKLLNILDQIDDFFIKGYCISLYQGKDFKSLFQVLQFRKKYNIYYTNNEIQQFFFANIILMVKKQVQNVSIYNYILIQNQYMILNSIQENNNQIISLIQMIIEMILLKPIENFSEAIKNFEHPFRYFLMDILQNDKTPQQIFDQMSFQKPFIEIDFQLAPNQREISYSQYMENMKHQINFHLRLKQFQTVLILINEVEDYIKINNYKISSDLLPHFINQFSKNLNSYILKSNEIKKILDILLIYYFKVSTFFALKKDFEPEVSKLIEGLKKCSVQLRVMFRQLSLNIKLENLSEIEQHIILKRRIKEKNEGKSSISSFERLNLINTLRKNKDYILILIQYQTQLQRYQNQFQAIKAIYQYFNKNFLLAGIHYSEIIQNQEMLISRDPAPTFLDIPLDHSPGLINFEQSSPTDEDNIINENLDTKLDLTECNKLYLTQLIYFKFLQMINLYDSQNERFQNFYKEFIEIEGAHETVFNYYLKQIKLLNKEKISKEDQKQELKCDVGKYLVIMQVRWNDINRKKFIKLISSDEEDFLKFQIMMFTNLKITLENRQIIQHQIDSISNKNVDTYCCMYQIRLIQQFFHLDNLQPVHHTLQYQTSLNVRDNKKQSQIELLKEYHKILKIKNESWFFHPGLEELQVFYYLSICFACSPKHLENLSSQNNLIFEKAELGIKQFQPNPKFYCQTLKFAQINNELVDELIFDASLGKFQQFQLFCQFLNCNIRFYKRLSTTYEKIQENLSDDFQSSILVLGLLHSFLYCQQNDVVDLMYQLIQRLLQSQAFIFHKIHKGFEQDLMIIDSIFKDNSNCLPAPYKYLFEYTNNFLYFEDVKFNSQYLLFNLMMNQDFFLIQEIIQESINTLKSQPQLIRLMHIFELLLDVVNAMIGYSEPQQQYIFKLNDYIEGTLIHAILAHLQCKYFMNLIDYENALKFSQIILQYIKTFMKQEKTIVSLFNDQLILEFQSNSQFDELHIKDYEFLKEESTDQDYVHLFNQDLINEAILNHLLILINLEQNLPKINYLFSLQLKLENKIHINYLQMIYAMYFNYFQRNLNSQSQLLLTDNSNQIEQIKLKIKNEETKQKVYFSLKMNILSDITIIDHKLKVLDFQLSIFQGAKNGISQKLITNWTILCAQNSIDGYSGILSLNKNIIHPYVSLMYLIQCESYRILNQILKAQTMLDQAEAGLKSWFESNKHPLKGLFFFHKGTQDRWLYSQYLICIQEIICLREFDKIEIAVIVQGLIYSEKQLLKAFDYYHSKLLKNITAHLANYVFSQIGKHVKQSIEQNLKQQDAKVILDNQIQSSSIQSLNGVTQYLDALAIFNAFETEHKCIDIIRKIIVEEDQ
ncbi:unnamed protein product [Paramecium sonneborni]|uniref:Anoctamin transmembrane domain-containing protein n=1 Tax=Paramecium sonneborni TaxID=65129 RepID=A0A8S1P3M1_9CILI|nr:unnamed protein product [Paramecium sonneborni]